jgi:radical SAM protein with 4Fe4S-binding SPASM domain
MKKWVWHIRTFFRLLRQMLVDGFIRRGYRKGMPEVLIMEPTNICNLRCDCCPHGNDNTPGRPAGIMEPMVFDKLLDNIDISVKEIRLYLHGEPFLNKHLDYMIGRISKKGILTTVYSNGYNIDLDLLDKVLNHRKTRFSFSADILNKAYYERIRKPARYEKMISCLEAVNTVFKRHRRTYEVSIIAERDEMNRFETVYTELFNRYDSLKRISFGSRFPWPEHFYTGELPQRLAKKRTLCAQIPKGLAIYWNGDVSLCSYDYSGKLLIGNLTENKLSDIYNSAQARKIRTYHYLRQFEKIPVCKACILPRYKSHMQTMGRREFDKKKHEEVS